MGLGFTLSWIVTIRVKVPASLSDILPHEVGEMAARPEGAASSHHSRIRAPLCELAESPLLVADSSRPPVVPSGGQEMDPLSLHKPWIEDEGREEDATTGTDAHSSRRAGQEGRCLSASHLRITSCSAVGCRRKLLLKAGSW